MKQDMQRMQTRRVFLSLGIATLACGMLLNHASAELRHDELPPRPKPRVTKDGSSSEIDNASIQLWPTPAWPNLWTVVQWVDGSEHWHDVDGWRGALNHPNYASWRVAQSEFGKGPFRWAIYDQEGGSVLALSELFHLPTNGGEILKIIVTLPASN